MNYEDNPVSIKYHVKRYLIAQKEYFHGKKVIDFPAGNGVTSRILKEIGAHPIPLDLFPEYFNIEGLECKRANIREGLPVEDESADALICQEGIEHFSDQYGALRAFNKVLKQGGRLLITTPNYSNIRSRLSYLLSESERYNDKLAPNELDSIWMSKQDITDEIYFGHIFLIGIQKLRVLAKLCGFRIVKCHPNRFKTSSVLLFPFLYPFIVLSTWISYRKRMRKNKDYDKETKKKTYDEVFKLSISPKILLSRSLMVEFEKEQDYRKVPASLKSQHKEFGTT